MILQNIPHELRALPQWVAAGENKHPLNPRTGQPASVTDPATWGTFEEAKGAGFRHIGFVLSESDPYCIVDLDDPATFKINGVTHQEPDPERVREIGARHARILAAFQSYAELSQSGTGVHIVCRGLVPQGVRRDKVELYSDTRYMIFTGNVIKNLPITDQQPLLTALFDEMQKDALASAELVQVASHLTDEQLYNMASTAANAEKFLRLWQGHWQGVPEWPSQSEADFALLSMLGFYSPDNEQCRRVFRWSALGRREKATKNDRYLNYALAKIRAKTPPPVDLSALLARGSALVPNETNNTDKPEIPTNESQNTRSEASIDSKTNQNAHVTTRQSLPPQSEASTNSDGEGIEASGTDTEGTKSKAPPLPPGFIGEVADYIYRSAIRPVPEIALCAAIGLTAGIVGRSYNISGTGLNQYLIVLAKTGSGKEGMSSGIDALVSAARPTVPMIDEFIGPGAFASGQALIRVLDKNPCFVSVLGEVGLTLQQICSPHANAAQVMLKKVLLDIYAKSGWTKVLRSSVYSDSDKNTKAIQAPNVTLLGESTPETFYVGLDAAGISEGLIPRFSIFEYTGPRPKANPGAFFPPPDALVKQLCALAATAMAAQQNRVCSPVQLDVDATQLMRDFDALADDKINDSSHDVARQLWNRAHVKALKMSALIAVGVNPYQPIITKQIAEWSIGVIQNDISRLFSKFDSGEVGTGDVRLEAHIKKAVRDWLRMKGAQRSAYQCPDLMLKQPLVPFHYLRRRAQQIADFKEDRRGVNMALKHTLDAMVEGEVLDRLPPATAIQFGVRGAVFGVGPIWK